MAATTLGNVCSSLSARRSILSENEERQIREWRSELCAAAAGTSVDLSIVFVGKTGAGKSSLINSLAGQAVAPEGHTLKGETSSVVEYNRCINGVNAKLLDTPGTRDNSTLDEETIATIASKCKRIDLLVYCLNMCSERISSDVTETMAKLTQKFGAEIWENAVIALTQANKLKIPLGYPCNDLKEFFVARTAEWKEVLVEFVLERKCGVASEIASKVLVIPTGYQQCSLPDREDWFSAFWACTFSKLKPEAQLGMFIASSSRFRQKETTRDTDSRAVVPYQRPIVAERVGDTLKSLPSIISTGKAFGEMGGIVISIVLEQTGHPNASASCKAVGGAVGSSLAVLGNMLYQAFLLWKPKQQRH